MRALAYASGLARRQGARLVVAQVITDHLVVPIDPWCSLAIVANASESARVDQNLNALRALALEADAACGRARYVSVRGDACAGLGWVADRTHAEVLVLGATRSVVRRLSGCSVSARLIHTRRWPVIVVP